ncbi:RyR domain-containing protein [Thermomonospora cellulosilytica]|uniref:Ryanodine receptor Ryr domain-containing protein n=1 Tax=Thermomonospora cellulosilytica TaxID=1411118 RepID=A0A7W3N1P3_9ACTN|nr:RyR domain-containing protein [Thermomonospora cellulosilytica]MBA9005900.1 hypothetical protein [Thermomonospora cellulosilytica]
MTTPEDIARIARVAHEANRAWQIATGDPDPSPPWEQAPAWQRDSAVAGVTQALAGAGPEELHEAWARRKLAEGWQYGPAKNAQARTHPSLVRYDLLPETERRKDELFAAVVRALTGGLQDPVPSRQQEQGEQQVPSVGRIVHYVSYGTPGGEYASQCRAAVVTEVNVEEPLQVGLCVLNPGGVFFRPLAEGGCFQAEGERRGGTWHWPERT